MQIVVGTFGRIMVGTFVQIVVGIFGRIVVGAFERQARSSSYKAPGLKAQGWGLRAHGSGVKDVVGTFRRIVMETFVRIVVGTFGRIAVGTFELQARSSS